MKTNQKKSNQMKIIAGASVAVLAVGYYGLYQWSKTTFLQAHTEAVEQMRQDGWDVESTPLSFSGFPFSITAHQEKFKASKTFKDNGISLSALSADMSVSVFNPLKYTLTGNMTAAVVRKNDPIAAASFEKADFKLGRDEDKYAIKKIGVHHTKLELLTPEKVPGLNAMVKHVCFEQTEHKVTTEADAKVVSKTEEILAEDITLTAYAHGTASPIGHLKEIKLSSKGKMPQNIAEQLAKIFSGESALGQICQSGGRVPALKETVTLFEKVGSFYELKLKIAHDDYTAKLDFEGRLESTKPVLALTVELENLAKFFDSFGVPPAVRMGAGFVFASDTSKSDKGKATVSVKNGTVTLNDKPVFKLPDFDWDNLTVPAEICEPLNKAAAVVKTVA